MATATKQIKPTRVLPITEPMVKATNDRINRPKA